MTGQAFNRRRAIVLGGLGVASLAAGVAGWIADTPAPATRGGGLQPATAGADLIQPPVLSSEGGRLQVELVAAAGVRLAGADTRALGFNGISPGPTLRVRPGDELAVRLTNRLDAPTNLHTHGLRVSPRDNGDNPFLRIDPGTSFDYLYRIPADHPAGTAWYHPHHHGMVADQIFGGLFGALLVDRGPDLPVTEDRVLLVSDITLDDGGGVVAADAVDRTVGREGRLMLVNGEYRPTVAAVPGAPQRWRLVNCCVSRVLSLRLEGHRLVQVALDGSFLPAPAAQDRVVLAPGNRCDVVVTPTGTGRHALVADTVDRGGMDAMMGGPGRGSPSGPVTLAEMDVSGSPVAGPALPATLPAETVAAGAPGTRRRIDFQMGMGMMGGAGGMAFTIDGRGYDPDRVDQAVTAGTVEEWTITNSGPLAHPFHLHVWPFTVLDGSDGPPASATPRDVVLVPAHGWVRLRIPFTTHSGRTVYHCHILDHEDRGMMATVEVRD